MLGALAMVAVTLISAFITMRFAIHGRESVVPALIGFTVDEASRNAGTEGLNITLENRFYSSDVAAGRILAQDPAPGSRVRRDWPVRITESLGGQHVTIPDLTGESERAATVAIRRLSLDLGVVAHLAVPGDPDVVLTQTPPVNSSGVDGPRVSLLVSDPDSNDPQVAYVMPSLNGLTFAAAAERAASAGLRLVVNPDNPQDPSAAVNSQTNSQPTPAKLSAGAAASYTANPPAAPTPPSPSSIVVAQSPPPGRRVVRGDAVHLTLVHPVAMSAISSQ